MANYHPDKDGVDHLNIYAMAKTEFGRFFSNMTDAPIELPYLGRFRTIEGLWYYLSNPNEKFKSVSGFEARKLAKQLGSGQRLPNDIFRYIIRNAIIKKAKKHGGLELCQRPEFKDLPLAHYYVYGKDHPNPKVVDETQTFKWWLEIIELVRTTANKESR